MPLLGLPQPLGSIDVSFLPRRLRRQGPAPAAQGLEDPLRRRSAHIVIVDDVLYTGRTTRAAINELFDYGRPARSNWPC
jgi:pyrimidine operon attenuation protein/uracil phosphoribosyltransferase